MEDSAGQPPPLQREARQLARSADAVEESTRDLADSADRRTELAANRTVLAAERTYAAWVRTGLAALASGIGAGALLEDLLPNWMASATGTVLVLFSAFCFGAAVWREIYAGPPPPRPDTPRLPPMLLVAVNGFLVLVALSALVGIWFGRTGGD